MISIEEYEKKKQDLINNILTVKNNIAISKSSVSNLFRHRNQGKVNKIDVSKFNNVISIDTINRIAIVEGMTTYETLVDETIKYELMPTVVPQLKPITIGGACSGLGIEASSFKYGLVHETVLELEILLSNGKTVICNKENEFRDLYFGFPNSYGTLGYAICVKVKLVPIKKYVQIQHLQYNNPEQYFSELEKIVTEQKVDFVDGTIFSETEMYVTVGEFTNTAPFLSDYTYINSYYKSIREKKVDYLTVLDYIWRWDTDWFWCSKNYFLQYPVIRYIWGKKNLNSKVYKKLMELNHRYPVVDIVNKMFGKKNESVIQDVQIPIDKCKYFIEFFHEYIKIKPIWICPTVIYDKNAVYHLYYMSPDTIYVNFGFWDTVPTNKEDGYYNRLIENKVKELDGKKSLYSSSYYAYDEFWELYNKTEYTKLKTKYDPEYRLKDLYEKCVLKK